MQPDKMRCHAPIVPVSPYLPESVACDCASPRTDLYFVPARYARSRTDASSRTCARARNIATPPDDGILTQRAPHLRRAVLALSLRAGSGRPQRAYPFARRSDPRGSQTPKAFGQSYCCAGWHRATHVWQALCDDRREPQEDSPDPATPRQRSRKRMTKKIEPSHREDPVRSVAA